MPARRGNRTPARAIVLALCLACSSVAAVQEEPSKSRREGSDGPAASTKGDNTSDPQSGPLQETPEISLEQAKLLLEARELDSRAVSLCGEAKFRDALSLTQKSLTIRQQILGKYHSDSRISVYRLGAIFNQQGEYRKALTYDLQYLELTGKAKGTQHAHYASALNNVALTYKRLGENATAEPLYQQALTIRKKTLGTEHPRYATSLHNLAALYEVMGKYGKARQLAQEALDILKRLHGVDHPKYALTLHNLAGICASMEEYAEAEQHYLQAIEIRRRTLGEDHIDYATSLGNLAGLYDRIGAHAKAEPLFREALATHGRLLGERHPLYLSSLDNYAGVCAEMGRYAEAEKCYQQALSMRREVLGNTHPDYATSLNNLGALYGLTGEYAEAARLHQEEIHIHERMPGADPRSLATSYANLGSVHVSMAEFAKAEKFFNSARELAQKAGENSSFYALVLTKLADVYAETGDYAKAEPLYRQALDIQKETLEQTHPDRGFTLTGLGDLLVSVNQPKEAEGCYREALRIEEVNVGPDHPRYGTVLSRLGLLFNQRGKYAEAEPLLKEVVRIDETVFGEAHGKVANALNNLAISHSSQGDVSTAATLYERAHAIKKTELSPTHPDYAGSLYNLFHFYFSLGRYDKAEPLARELAVSEIRFASELARFLPEARAVAMQKQLRGCDPLLAVMRKTSPDRAAEAYEAVWETRGLVLRTMIQRRGIRTQTPEAQEVVRQLQGTGRRLAQLSLIEPTAMQRAAWLNQLTSLNNEKERLEAQLGHMSLQYHRTREIATTQPEDLARLLDPGSAVVELVQTTDWNPSRDDDHQLLTTEQYDAFVLRRADDTETYHVSWIDLGPIVFIDSAIDAFRTEITGKGSGTQPQHPERILREQVWDKLEPHLVGCSHVVIIPDGQFNFLPWNALPGRRPNSYLIEDYALSTITHGQQLYAQLTEKSETTGNVLLAGGIEFGKKPASQPHASVALAANEMVRASAYQGQPVWDELPGMQTEVEAIASLWPGPTEVMVVSGERADESAMRSLMPQSRYIHLATHGFFASERFRSRLPAGPENPAAKVSRPTVSQFDVVLRNPLLLSGVVLAGANRLPPTDEHGVATGDDIAGSCGQAGLPNALFRCSGS